MPTSPFQVPTYGKGFPLFYGLTYGTDCPLFPVPTYGSDFPLNGSEITTELISHLRITPHHYYMRYFEKNQPLHVGRIFNFYSIVQYIVFAVMRSFFYFTSFSSLMSVVLVLVMASRAFTVILMSSTSAVSLSSCLNFSFMPC